MPPITCHILDTVRGKPAADVTCAMTYLGPTADDTATASPPPFAVARTNADGRVPLWVFDPNGGAELLGVTGQLWDQLVPGVYRIRFLTGAYFAREAVDQASARTFFPFVDITFAVANPPDAHYHVPLLLSNHSYSTYRGS